MLSLNSEKIFTKRNFPGYLDQRLTDRADQISGVGADKLSTDTDKLSKDTDIGSVCVCVSHWISTVFKKYTVSKFPFVESTMLTHNSLWLKADQICHLISFKVKVLFDQYKNRVLSLGHRKQVLVSAQPPTLSLSVSSYNMFYRFIVF